MMLFGTRRKQNVRLKKLGIFQAHARFSWCMRELDDRAHFTAAR